MNDVRVELRSRDGTLIGSLAFTLEVWDQMCNRTGTAKCRPDAFRIGQRFFVWSSRFNQYREPEVVDVAQDDPLVWKLFARKIDPVTSTGESPNRYSNGK